MPRLAERLLQRVVGHQRADHRPAQAAAALPVVGQHVDQVVAVGRPPSAVDEQHAVAVAVEGDAEIGARSRERRAASGSGWVEPTPSLMLRPLGSTPIAIDARAQFAQNTCGPTGRSRRCAQSSAISCRRRSKTLRHGVLAGFDVAAERVAVRIDLAQLLRATRCGTAVPARPRSPVRWRRRASRLRPRRT